MRFLADAGISPKTVDFLNRLGHEAIHVRTMGLERSSDRAPIERAQADGRAMVTFDLDFGDILALGPAPEAPVVTSIAVSNRSSNW
jgi:predicted nuclease of predicted toxin-antitoxin system